ncbi:MAG: hypothetical protein EOO08_03960 [Chitinophagaceae bacterium]|nr:MAG: hypothetical protein EOO08_03960 [Chitinophagaceae bacterium]
MLPCINRAGAEHRGDGIARSYGFRYDGAGRLTSAEFNQQNKGSVDWTADKVDYSVSGLSYDAGGNILSMTQTGLKLGAIQTIDELTYTYFANSNRLKKVADAITGPSTLGDFTDTTAVTDDYDYDVNGNVVRDNNRRMHTASGAGAVYNLLDRPDSIVTAGKNTVYYTYDAAGGEAGKESKRLYKWHAGDARIPLHRGIRVQGRHAAIPVERGGAHPPGGEEWFDGLTIPGIRMGLLSARPFG